MYGRVWHSDDVRPGGTRRAPSPRPLAAPAAPPPGGHRQLQVSMASWMARPPQAFMEEYGIQMCDLVARVTPLDNKMPFRHPPAMYFHPAMYVDIHGRVLISDYPPSPSPLGHVSGLPLLLMPR